MTKNVALSAKLWDLPVVMSIMICQLANSRRPATQRGLQQILGQGRQLPHWGTNQDPRVLSRTLYPPGRSAWVISMPFNTATKFGEVFQAEARDGSFSKQMFVSRFTRAGHPSQAACEC